MGSMPRKRRNDVLVPNESDGLVFASANERGRGLDPGTRAWSDAVADCRLLPIAIESEDAAVVRVIVGGELEPAEAAGWLGRLECGLRLPGGELRLCGGIGYVLEGEGEHARQLPVPAGSYRATLLCYASSSVGHACLERAGADEPLGTWFRRTRAGEPMPDWLHDVCVNDPHEDPGHQGAWRRARLRSRVPVVDFVLHLVPVPGELSPPAVGEHGFAEVTECRKPERFPDGIAAVGLAPARAAAGRTRRSQRSAEPRGVIERCDLAPVTGAAVALPLKRLGRLYRVAAMCHAYTLPHLTVELPPGSSPAIPEGADAIEGAELRATSEGLSVDFEDSGQEAGAAHAMGDVAKLLSGLPDGSRITLDCARRTIAPGRIPPGLHRYRGTVAGGSLVVSESFPEVAGAVLGEALALAELAEGPRLLIARDEEEAARIEARVRRHVPEAFANNPLQRSGRELSLRRRDPLAMSRVAQRAFWMRYRDVWPIQDDDLADA